MRKRILTAVCGVLCAAAVSASASAAQLGEVHAEERHIDDGHRTGAV